MKRPRTMKSIFLSTGLAVGLSVLTTVSAYAYTPGLTDYTTVSGDSLYKISLVFHTTVDKLMTVNHLADYSLRTGQKLTVPGDTYTARQGDTMYLISQKYKMPLSELQRANNNYSDKLDIGQRLAVPLAASAPQVTTTPATQAPAAPAPQTPSASSQTSAYSAADLDLLARLICAEAQGESYQAKVGVGAVVMNRVESGLFADSIRAVIYQNINGYYQFTPVVNGWIDKPADEESIRAAKDALNGSDPTNNAIWYYDDSATNQFMLAKKIAVKIDHMVFAY